MNLRHAPRASTENRQRHSLARVPRRWLAMARAVWMVLALVLLANFSASVLATYGQLRTVCTNAAFGHCTIWQPTPANLQALGHLGLSLDTYAAYTLTMDVLASLVFLAVGALIFWRKSDEWLGLFVSLVLVIFGSFGIADSLAGTFLTAQTPGALKLLYLLLLLQWPALGVLLLTFPTGRFVPSFSWVVVLLWLLQDWFFTFGTIGNWPLLLIAADLLLVLGSTAGIQVYRYLCVYTPLQRQQTRWLVYTLSVYVVGVVLLLAIGGLVPAFSRPDSPYRLARANVTILFFTLIPLCIGIAILRYRLAGMISQQNAIAIVTSTLAIAALFQPLRYRMQQIIDRRFYRRKYDAARVVEAFSTTLRHEVDLEQVREQLVAVVQETMQPEYISLWLPEPDSKLLRSDHIPPRQGAR